MRPPALQPAAATGPAPSAGKLRAVNADALHVIVYVSAATQLLDRAELQTLLEHARARNVREGITGLLLYSEGSFMQHLEGPAEPLRRVYSCICVDSRHRSVIELLNEPVGGREFDRWSMGFLLASQQTLTELAPAEPHAGKPSLLVRGRGLLQKFWEHQRRRT